MTTNIPTSINDAKVFIQSLTQACSRVSNMTAVETYQNAQRMIALKEQQLKRILPTPLYHQARTDLLLLLEEMKLACDKRDYAQTKAIFIKIRNYQPVFKPKQDQKLDTAYNSVKALFHNLEERYCQALEPDNYERVHRLLHPIMVRATNAYRRNDAASVADIHQCMDMLFKFVKTSDVIEMIKQ